MQDLYERLGVASDASLAQIKNAYHKLALKEHPDKGGDAIKMRLLNEAYCTLFDPVKRREFDRAWETYHAGDTEAESSAIAVDYLAAGHIRSFSDSYRQEHANLSRQYTATPLPKYTPHIEPSIFCPDFRRMDEIDEWRKLHINPTIAIKLLVACISGGYHDEVRLNGIKNYLTEQIAEIISRVPKAPELGLYTGVQEIVIMLPKPSCDQGGLIFAMQKITNFAKQASDTILEEMMPLFYNKFFRELYNHALAIYWQPQDDLLIGNPRKEFDGYHQTQDFLNLFRERLARESDGHLNSLVQSLTLLFRFEKDLHETDDKVHPADSYRAMAWHALDWIPVLMERCSKSLILNTFLQIGILLQKAATLEISANVKMADEQIALQLYMMAISMGQYTTPDVETYINTQIIKYLSVFHFANSTHDEIVLALKKRTLVACDIFPFFAQPQANIEFFRQQGQSLNLMRTLLNVMLHAYEHNKTHGDIIPIEHTQVDILYQVYEACLKNWFQEEYNPDVEKECRLKLMEELLLDNVWSSMDVEALLTAPWIMVDRDEGGWLKPTRALPFAEDAHLTSYSSIEGVEINHETGHIRFFMTPWAADRPVYERTFTIHDVQDMLERNLGGAIFSLDPVDPDKPFHPFNLMRFAPDELYESELLNTMLLTDYVLKFLTTNQEVQGQYPFESREVAAMIAHLPAHLRDIIDQYQASPHVGALHRFWIEAEEVDIDVTDPSEAHHYTMIGLLNIKMVVKKHRMERNIHGELKDIGNEDEGWQIYVLNNRQMREVQAKTQIIPGRAMVFMDTKEELYFVENNEILKKYRPKDYRETLIRLFEQPKDADGKVIVSTKNLPLIYRVTTQMAEQAEFPHHFSAEFIFAHQFTTHYDEFAQYLPEFGRLKELSKMSVLTRLLSNMKQQNDESLISLDALMAPIPPLPEPTTAIYLEWSRKQQEIQERVAGIFNNTNPEFSVDKIRRTHRENLTRMKREIGTLEFNDDSPEVVHAFDEMVSATVKHNNYRFLTVDVRSQLKDKRSEIARAFSAQKKESVRRQLKEILIHDSVVDAFIRGDIDPAVDYFVKTNLQRQFPDTLEADIMDAMGCNARAIQRIARYESNKVLSKHRDSFQLLRGGFDQINLGKRKESAPEPNTCFWVPASVRHEVRRDATSGLTRYSFFVYGGVSIQPRTNIISGGSGRLRGTPVGGGSFDRATVTRGFQDHHIISDKNRLTRNHELWQLAGLNTNSRSNRIYLPSGAGMHPTRSVHSGRHIDSYSFAMAERMRQVVGQGKAGGWSQAQYREETLKMLSGIRQELRAGNIALNRNHRPWAKKI